MRIKEYRRLSVALMVLFAAIAAAGAVIYLAYSRTAGVALVIIGIAGFMLSSLVIRLYGRMAVEKLFKRA